MCYVFCKQFKGWCKSFTKTELYLTIAQGILLGGFIAFLTFLILHLIACHRKELQQYSLPTNVSNETTESSVTTQTSMTISMRDTLPQNVQCTWDPSHKTETVTHYYYTKYEKFKTDHVKLAFGNTTKGRGVKKDDDIFIVERDGVTELKRNNFVLALVKIKPPQDVVFGCILTVVNQFWTITASSCIESIEEVDSLDSFVMMEKFGERHGPVHAVSDVMIHPLYQGTNKSYDLAALKSEDRLNGNVAKLASILDYLLITLGENLDILGFGKFRSIDKHPLARTVHSVTVNILPLKQCESGDESWALRHLVPEGELVRQGCGVRQLCAGLLAGRSTPCNYCAGTPLLRGRVVVGIMSDNQHCGLACEPNLYVNVAELRDWIDSVIKVD
ncbi:thrombin-like enzyme contortrixobin [Zerene cesonia]|uniref:thrombin-like enzyme contortrixobin n=1 Tax=Zerene cesonia TaxID=33412 RepID=UPI0018E55734|nr:thrombin-like enzyme contortrixobin [Zerene cesonia]